MALSRSTISSKVKNYLYNTGIGEKPSIRQTSGNSTVSGDTVTFNMASGEGAKVRAGQVLSTYGATDTSDAYGFYVLSISTDTITAVNGYEGAAIPNSTSVGLLEHQAPVTEFRVHQAIDDIIDNYLYPEVFDLIEDEIASPNLTTGQSNADAADERVFRAWQQLGGIWYQIPAKIVKNVDTSMFASGRMIAYDAMHGSAIKYSAVRKVTIANSTDTALEDIIAKGAAALCLEGTEPSTQWEYTKNDARERSQQGPSMGLWSSFYQARRNYSESLSRESVLEFKIDRG